MEWFLLPKPLMSEGYVGDWRMDVLSGNQKDVEKSPPVFMPSRISVPALSILSSSQDSTIVVESFKSGFEPPGDFPFEDFSLNLSRTGSDGTISNTPKGDRERDGAPGPRPDPKHPMSRTKNKLWLFGKKPKVKGSEGRLHVYILLHGCRKINIKPTVNISLLRLCHSCVSLSRKKCKLTITEG